VWTVPRFIQVAGGELVAQRFWPKPRQGRDVEREPSKVTRVFKIKSSRPRLSTTAACLATPNRVGEIDSSGHSQMPGNKHRRSTPARTQLEEQVLATPGKSGEFRAEQDAFQFRWRRGRKNLARCTFTPWIVLCDQRRRCRVSTSTSGSSGMAR